jgi:hypothetical protein
LAAVATEVPLAQIPERKGLILFLEALLLLVVVLALMVQLLVQLFQMVEMVVLVVVHRVLVLPVRERRGKVIMAAQH